TVTAYETLVSPASMTTDWINNRGGGLGTVVLSGPIHVPAASPTFPTPQPWGVMLPFQAPFPFDRNNGHFLLEIEGNDPANLFDAWPVDAENWWRTARGDSTRVSGDPCVGAGGERVTLSMPAAASLVLGGTMTVGMGGTVLPAYANWLGTSNRSYLGVPLPFDLGLVGAPGCLLGTDPALQQIGAGPFAWPIPLVPALENEVLFTQALGLAAGANPGGFVTSDVYQVRLGGASSPMSRTQTVYRRSNLSLPTGFMSAASFHGPICRFHGVFN
ncbi:MAG TPA: hypothetical protein VK081_06735, partial [Planctomycetota bacterium]|nr:hypothetical protein [Planctomycetota bacterium]